MLVNGPFALGLSKSEKTSTVRQAHRSGRP